MPQTFEENMASYRERKKKGTHEAAVLRQWNGHWRHMGAQECWSADRRAAERRLNKPLA